MSLTTTLGGTGYTTNIDQVAPIWVAVPASATAPGIRGQIASDASFFYVCIALNTWVRVALLTW
jgi:hypothetical protein